MYIYDIDKIKRSNFYDPNTLSLFYISLDSISLIIRWRLSIPVLYVCGQLYNSIHLLVKTDKLRLL